MDLQGKVALVTGGAAGIGLECVTHLLDAGVRGVGILDLSESAGNKAMTDLEARFGAGRVIFYHTDVTKEDQLKDAFEKTMERFGGLDIVINNAGVGATDDWELMIATNFTAVVRGTMLGMELMGREHGGTVLNIASIFGLTAIAGAPVYVAAKHAVVGLSRSLGMQYHTQRTGVRVRVLALCPGYTFTDMFKRAVSAGNDGALSEAVRKVARMPIQQVDAVARAAVEMLRRASSGSVWVVDGGQPPYDVRALTLEQQRA